MTRARVTPGIVWPSGHYPEDHGPDPADETLMSGAEYESRMRLRASNAKEREKMRLDAIRDGVRYPAWLAEHLGLCPRCQRSHGDPDHRLCELCRAWGESEEFEKEQY